MYVGGGVRLIWRGRFGGDEFGGRPSFNLASATPTWFNLAVYFFNIKFNLGVYFFNIKLNLAVHFFIKPVCMLGEVESIRM